MITRSHSKSCSQHILYQNETERNNECFCDVLSLNDVYFTILSFLNTVINIHIRCYYFSVSKKLFWKAGFQSFETIPVLVSALFVWSDKLNNKYIFGPVLSSWFSLLLGKKIFLREIQLLLKVLVRYRKFSKCVCVPFFLQVTCFGFCLEPFCQDGMEHCQITIISQVSELTPLNIPLLNHAV